MNEKGTEGTKKTEANYNLFNLTTTTQLVWYVNAQCQHTL